MKNVVAPVAPASTAHAAPVARGAAAPRTADRPGRPDPEEPRP